MPMNPDSRTNQISDSTAVVSTELGGSSYESPKKGRGFHHQGQRADIGPSKDNLCSEMSPDTVKNGITLSDCNLAGPLYSA